MLNQSWRSVLLWALILPVGTWDATATILPPSVNTSAAPSAIAIGSTTFVFYKGSGTDPGIYMTGSNGSIDPGNWTDAVRLPVEINTSAAPSAVTDGTVIYVVYKGSGEDTAIYIAASFDSTETWVMTSFPGYVNTSTAPGAFISGGHLYVFYKGSGSDPRIYVTPIISGMQWQLLSVTPHH